MQGDPHAKVCFDAVWCTKVGVFLQARPHLYLPGPRDYQIDRSNSESPDSDATQESELFVD